MTDEKHDSESLGVIQQLADHVAISQLLDRYARLLDERTFTTTLPALYHQRR